MRCPLDGMTYDNTPTTGVGHLFGHHLLRRRLCHYPIHKVLNHMLELHEGQLIQEGGKVQMAVETPRMRSIDDLPGPPRLPLIGNVHQLIRPSRRYAIVERWARRYGPIMRIDSAGRQVVGISDADEVYAIMRNRPDGFRRWSDQLEISKEMMNSTSLVFAAGEDWKRQRRLVVTALSTSRLHRYFDVITTSTERLYRRLAEAAHDGRVLEIHHELASFTVDITAWLAFGEDLNTLERGENELQGHVRRVMRMVGRRLAWPIPYWRWFRLPADRALERSLAEISRAVSGFIEQARMRMRERPELWEEPENFLEAMLAVQEADGGLADNEIVGNTLAILEAGESATAHMLGWTVWFLASRPDVQARMAQEADEALDDGQLFPCGYETVASLRYTEAVLRESLRLKSVAPLVPVEPLMDTTICGTHIPAGTRMLLLTQCAGQKASAFQRADDFEPERWLQDGDSELRAVDQKSYLAFGAGPRFCPGRNLTFLEAKVVMAMIARNFQVELCDSGGPVREDFSSSMCAPQGLRVRLRKRAGAMQRNSRNATGQCPREEGSP
jgi:cytochrome P450